MDKFTIDKIIELRKQNIGIGTIAKQLNVSYEKARYHCKKNNLGGARAETTDHGKGLCEVCGCEFSKNTTTQKYCSEECRKIIFIQQMKEHYTKKKNQKSKYIKICKFCNKEYKTTNKSKKYCSDTCCNKFNSKNRIDTRAKERNKKCKYCGIEFIDESKTNNKQYCSNDCHKNWMKENPRYTKTCLQCNVVFKTNDKTAKYCSKECQWESLKETNKGKIPTNAYEKLEEEKIINRLKEKFPKFTYTGGFTGVDGYFNLKCNECGHEFKRSAQILKPSKKQNISCQRCLEIEKEDKTKKLREFKEKERLKKIEERKRKELEKKKELLSKIKTLECEECGEKFKTSKSNIKYCSDICRKRASNRRKEKRIYLNGKPDTSITITKLIERDNNTCYLCGEQCDSEDYNITNEGYFITGEKYPTIEHVVALSNGGTHTWDNVKLACFRCNTLKIGRASCRERV